MLIYYVFFGLHATYDVAYKKDSETAKVNHADTAKIEGP
jgi:hypothetical protein